MGFSVNRRNSLRSPACAEKSQYRKIPYRPRRDHPRVCGEKPGGAAARRQNVGSPPRVRGKVGRPALPGLDAGITPACAGKSGGDRRHRCNAKGSPPRVRGKGLAGVGRAEIPGITPACAGKRSRRPCRSYRSGDHPRVCGEKYCGCSVAAMSLGSPPRVRGKETPSRMVQNCLRITPACAGKSPAPNSGPPQSWDHPRVCGEKASSSPSILAPQGSPPRVRGKGRGTSARRRCARITPACAGKSRVDPSGFSP